MMTHVTNIKKMLASAAEVIKQTRHIGNACNRASKRMHALKLLEAANECNKASKRMHALKLREAANEFYKTVHEACAKKNEVGKTCEDAQYESAHKEMSLV